MYGLLAGNVSISTVTGAVFVVNKRQNEYPCVELGVAHVLPAHTLNGYAKSYTGEIRFWSQANGDIEIAEMMDATEDLLTADPLIIAGWTATTATMEHDEVIFDPTHPEIRRGYQRIRIYLKRN